MQRFSRIKNIVLVLVICITCSSWGFLVHKTTLQLAVYQLPKSMQPFFYLNIDYLVLNAGRPDTRRNTDTTEGPKHFIDLEKFGDYAAYNMPHNWDSAKAKYSADSLLLYGYVPYQVVYMKDQLASAFRTGNQDSILFYATDMAHYIGDANVPLHTTENYDGQFTDQKGIHSLWESMIPEIELGNYSLYSSHKARYLDDPADAMWKAIQRANALLPAMLATEKELSLQFTPETKYRTQIRRGKEVRSYSSDFAKRYAAALGSTINDQLLYSSNLIADFWYTAWMDAGKPDLVNFSREQKHAFKSEQKMYKHNELLKNNLLRSKKDLPKTADQ